MPTIGLDLRPRKCYTMFAPHWSELLAPQDPKKHRSPWALLALAAILAACGYVGWRSMRPLDIDSKAR